MNSKENLNTQQAIYRNVTYNINAANETATNHFINNANLCIWI